MKKPVTIIGAETEYGIFVTTDDGRVYGGSENRRTMDQIIESMLEEGISITGGVCRDTETFASVEEHNEAERFLHDQGNDDAIVGFIDEPEEPQVNMSQRRGYTGSMLVNGARFYKDMSHPEYSIPECIDPYSALCAQKAGDAIVARAALAAEPLASTLTGSRASVHIVKNNSDGQGHSYAGHENYLASRVLFRKLCEETPESDIVTLFFVARQIVIGAGKIGAEGISGVPFQISQRADFFSQRFSLDTTISRGIINVRDSPYADRFRLARFHVIVGDSNRSDLSLFLKFGMTALLLMMLESGFLERERFPWWGVALSDPVGALWHVSHDLSLTKKLSFNGERGEQEASALEIMRDFWTCAEKFVHDYSLPAVWSRVTTLWNEALQGLEGDRHAHPVSRSLDWVAVERVLLNHIKRTGADFESDSCRSLELSYRTLGNDSVFAALQKRGQIMTIAKEADVQRLVREAPNDTRAYLRAEIIKRYRDDIAHLRWDSIHFKREIILLNDPSWGGETVAHPLFLGDPPLEEFLERARQYPREHIQILSDLTWRRTHERSRDRY